MRYKVNTFIGEMSRKREWENWLLKVTSSNAFRGRQATCQAIENGGPCSVLERKPHLKIFTYKNVKNIVLVKENMPVCWLKRFLVHQFTIEIPEYKAEGRQLWWVTWVRCSKQDKLGHKGPMKGPTPLCDSHVQEPLAHTHFIPEHRVTHPSCQPPFGSPVGVSKSSEAILVGQTSESQT